MNILALSNAPSLRLLSAGQSKMANAAPSSFLTKNVWVLELITVGQLEICVDETDWKILSQGEGVIYAPKTNYRERVTAPGRVSRSMYLFFELGSPGANKAWERFDVSHLLVHDDEHLL